MAEMNVHNLQRLQEAQEKALIETDCDLERWNEMRSDYMALQDRLKTLPHKKSHEIMVPFGKFAFMPGKLVHTNEILVLLGDDYFLERTAFQASEIVDRRLTSVDENIGQIQQQRKMLASRAEATSQMMNIKSGLGGQQEIEEEYDEEKEKLWREQHKKYLRQAAQKRQKEKMDKEKMQEGKVVLETDDDILKRLEQLEEQENCRNELTSKLVQSEEDDDDAINSLSEDETDSTEEEEEDLSEEEDDESETEEEDVCQTRKVITFSHTKCDTSPTSSPERDDDVINSPADLYRWMKTGPKSILKCKSQNSHSITATTRNTHADPKQERRVSFKVESERGLNGSSIAEAILSAEEKKLSDAASALPQVKAVSDIVMEKTPSATCVSLSHLAQHKPDAMLCNPTNMKECQDKNPSGMHNVSAPSTRPVSKFRASRMKQGSSS